MKHVFGVMSAAGEKLPTSFPLARKWSYTIAVAVLTLLTVVGAKVAIPLPGTPVPATLQTLPVLLAGLLLGSRLGALSQAAYVAIGLAGLPVFALPGAGPAYLLGPTGGYLIGFMAAAWLAGALAGPGSGAGFARRLAAVAVAIAAIHAAGVLWLSCDPVADGYRIYDETGKAIARTFDPLHRTKLGKRATWSGAVAPLDVTEGAKEAAVYPPVPPAPKNTDGAVPYYLYANPSIWPYKPVTPWMRDHYDLVEAYHPSWDPYTDDIRSIDYIDVTAIYKATSGLPQLPQYALKDQNGHYVMFYGNSEYLADVGNQAWWDQVAIWCQQAIDAGFVGFKFDDVNYGTIPFSSGYPPINPRTGKVYALPEWRRDLANGMEYLGSKFSNAIIVHNSIWFDHPDAEPGIKVLDDPDVQRIVRAATHVEYEHVYTNSGMTAGAGKYGYQTCFAHVEKVHSLGAGAVFLNKEANDPVMAMFGLACVLLTSNGNDWQFNAMWEPDGWAGINDLSIGESLGDRYQTGTYQWRRDFSGGYVWVREDNKTGQVVTS